VLHVRAHDGLALEARGDLGEITGMRLQQLERDRRPQDHVLGEVHGPIPPWARRSTIR